MTPKLKAEDLINSYRIILMNEDTECGNEILCTTIAKQSALITVDEILAADMFMMTEEQEKYWEQVKQEILAL
jgi:hypothetical protein